MNATTETSKASKSRLVFGWVAITLLTAASGFWTFWGIIEGFHEGWCKPTRAARLLQLLAYLSPAITLTALAGISVRWSRFGAVLCILVACLIGVGMWKINASFSYFITATILLVPLLVGFLLLKGSTTPRWIAYLVALGVPALVLVVSGTEPIFRVSNRFDDGVRTERDVQGNDVRLVWAPAGPGWTRDGKISWDEARQRVRLLNRDGKSLSTEPVDIWRLPTRAEVVHSLTRHNENCGGNWNSTTESATYKIKPDKESPIWDRYAPLIYLWTSEPKDEERAWIVVYHGGVFAKIKSTGSSSLGFRAVRDP